MGALARLNWTAVAAAAAIMLGCASAATPAKEQQPEPQGTPLAAMAGRPVLVLPIQYAAFADSLNWRGQIADGGTFLSALDDSIAAELGDRGLRSWTFAPAITASARRNAGMTADPHALAAESLRRRVQASDDPLSEPLASQIRSLVALRDARYVILPAILRFENGGAGARASLLVYLIDSRTARIRWSGEVSSEVTRSSPTMLAGGIAQRLADLVVAR
jgi:hypothetical protein